METNLDRWKTHDWCDRPLEIEPGKKIIQFVCRKCGRGFVYDFTDEIYAVHISVFTVNRLSDEITSRWLSEPCPLERLPGDLDDEKTRFANGPSALPPRRSSLQAEAAHAK